MTTAVAAPWLLCAATPWEARPLAKRLSLTPAGSGRWEGARAVLVETGMGAPSLPSAGGRFGGVLSVGLAGSLQPDVVPGDLVVDLRGGDAELPPRAREIARGLGARLHFGSFVQTDRVIGPEEKRRLGREKRACAVDMETQALRAWADGRGLPAYAVRVVLDGLEDRLPSGPRAADVLAFVAAAPHRLPFLLKLGWRQKRGMETLARFLERFLPLL